MSIIHSFQRTLFVLFLSLALIFYFTQLNKRRTEKNREKSQNENSFTTYENNFGSFKDVQNISSKEIFHALEFLNISFELNNKEASFSEKAEPVYVLGLFELTTKLGGENDGESELMAAKMAVKHVNALNVIPGSELVLLVNDTQCDPGVAIDRFFHAVYSKKTIVMLLSSGCSNVTEALAHVVPYWNIMQISYGSKSPTLSDRSKFPLFFRTVAPESSHNIAKVHFIKHLKWHVVATFSQSENSYLLPINHLITELEKVNVSCNSTVTFSVENYKDQLKVLKSLDIRIVIGSFSETLAPKIFCAAYHLNMYNEYVWILEETSKLWWRRPVNGCSVTELMKAVKGVIMIGDYENAHYDDMFLDNMKTDSKNFSYIHSTRSMKYAKKAYDAIWAMSLALRLSRRESLKNFNYKNKESVCSFLEAMKTLKFMGLSGPVRFNGADRIGDLVVTQIQEDGVAIISLYDSIKDTLNFDCKFCQKIYWKNGYRPMAHRILKETLVTIPKALFYTIAGASCVGIVCSLSFLYFNLKFRRVTTIKLSSPNLNNLAVIGCIFVYFSVILSDLSLKTNDYFNELCSVKIYLLSAGLSLTFGSMLTKSYRVHRIFAYSIPSLMKNKLLKDQQLIGLILIPLFIDTLIMGIWIRLDPLEKHLHDLVVENNKDDSGVVYQPQVELCLCNNTVGWHIALFGYKTIILIMGVYMAWKTRHVKVPALNESQYIAICVYSAVFSTIIVIASSFVTEYFVLSYLAKTLSILASTTITLVLMFLPKFKSIFGRVDIEMSIMKSMGLKEEYNTRRFLWDDPKEMLCRLEIQNKVYRCELEALDKEIQRLEELLRNPGSAKSNINITQIYSDINFLNVPRASWPRWQEKTIKPFSSENKLNNRQNEKNNFLGKLKMFFGSLSSLQFSYNNLDEKIKDSYVSTIKPRSNPEIFRHIVWPVGTDLGKIKSESCIKNSY